MASKPDATDNLFITSFTFLRRGEIALKPLFGQDGSILEESEAGRNECRRRKDRGRNRIAKSQPITGMNLVAGWLE